MAIIVENLTHSYTAHTAAIDDISLTVGRGRAFAAGP